MMTIFAAICSFIFLFTVPLIISSGDRVIFAVLILFLRECSFRLCILYLLFMDMGFDFALIWGRLA
jgi:hypothetical protein